MRYGYVSFCALLSWACTSQTSIPSDVVVDTGQESDIWTAPPPVSTVRAELVLGAERRLLAEGPAPLTALPIDTSQGVSYGTLGQFEITGKSADGAIVARGTTVPFALTSLEGITVPIFTARSASWSRPSGALEHSHQHAVVTAVLHQYVIAAGGMRRGATPSSLIFTTLRLGQP